MTAAQTTLSQKASHPMSGPIAVVAASLMIAVIGVAIVARPVAAPASTYSGNTSPVLTLGHDESRFSVPTLTFGHDEHAAGTLTVTVPLIPRGGGSDRGK